jgi:lipopolysaccharide transport system ATP-binding protein
VDLVYSMSTVITVENLGKKYLLNHQAQRQPYVALRDVIADNCKSIGRKIVSPFLSRHQSPSVEDFWALKDVSFEVKQGDRVGIIGRNGAGKSTLLKILSRIVEPTTGRVRIKGRVASLLEVGTGFHPELTGRENIFLNGAILGMTRAEIRKKFDEIVDFAEIEKFLDTPVKRYSSGMYVRLAFAVAAHLEPEILLVDEVLAVGDAQFQKKCLGKMEDVSKNEGRAVLFVSHNMGAISTLTNRAIFIDSGLLVIDDTTANTVERYLSSGFENESRWNALTINSKPIQILRISVKNEDGNCCAHYDVMKGVQIIVDYEVREKIIGAVIAINIHSSDGSHIISLEDTDNNKEVLLCRLPGHYRTEVSLPGAWLNSGTYYLRVGSGIPRVTTYENIEALRFVLVETGDTTMRGHRAGYLVPMLKWQTDALRPRYAGD